MYFKTESVTLTSIDTSDQTYRITTRENIDDLTASFETVGLLNFPFLRQIDSGFMIVSGFRRIAAAAHHLNAARIDARIVKNGNPLAYVKLAIADNSSQRELNLIETSRSLSLLSAVCQDTESLAGAAEKLGLPCHPAVVDKIIGLCRLPRSFQEALLAGTVSVSMANDLAMLAGEEGELLVGFFNDFKMSLNKQKEVFVTLMEIAARDERSISDIFQDSQLKEILENADMDRVLKTQKVRRYLKQIRFPSISKANDAFEKSKKKLGLGNRVDLIAPKNFESPEYRLNLTFHNQAELRNLSNQVERLLGNPVISEIIPE